MTYEDFKKLPLTDLSPHRPSFYVFHSSLRTPYAAAAPGGLPRRQDVVRAQRQILVLGPGGCGREANNRLTSPPAGRSPNSPLVCDSDNNGSTVCGYQEKGQMTGRKPMVSPPTENRPCAAGPGRALMYWR